MYLFAAVPSLLLTILLFMDQQITTVIVNRKEHKLKVVKRLQLIEFLTKINRATEVNPLMILSNRYYDVIERFWVSP